MDPQDIPLYEKICQTIRNKRKECHVDEDEHNRLKEDHEKLKDEHKRLREAYSKCQKQRDNFKIERDEEREYIKADRAQYLQDCKQYEADRVKYEANIEADRLRFQAECEEFNKQRSGFYTSKKELEDQIQTTETKLTRLTEEIELKKDAEFELKQTNIRTQIELSKVNTELTSARDAIAKYTDDFNSLKEDYRLLLDFINKQKYVYSVACEQHTLSDHE
jgi:chromosome segregation ATPase